MGSGLGVLSLSMHRALALVAGAALLVLPFILSSSPASTIACVVLGALVLTLELSSDREGRGSAGMGHLTADRFLALALAIVALVLALTSEDGAAVVCALSALTLGALTFVTRYSVRPGIDDESRATTVT